MTPRDTIPATEHRPPASGVSRFLPELCKPLWVRHRVLVLALVVIILPFVHTTGPLGVRLAKMLAFVLVGGLMGAMGVASRVNRALGAIYACAVVSAVHAGFGPVHATALCFVTAGVFVAVYASTISLSELRLFFKALLVVGALQGIYGFVQMCGYDPLFERVSSPDSWLPVGSLGQQTLYGPFMVVTVCVALYLKPVMVPLLVIPALCTLSTMTLLSLIGVGCLFIVTRSGWRAGVMLACVLSTLGCLGYFIRPELFVFDPQGRLAVWKSLLTLWLRHPWFGWGLGSYEVVAPLALPSHIVSKHGVFLQAHNDYLQVLFELGGLGLLCGGYAFFEFFTAAKRAYARDEGKVLVSIFLALAINALGSFPLHTPTLALVFILSWSWTVSDRLWSTENIAASPHEEAAR